MKATLNNRVYKDIDLEGKNLAYIQEQIIVIGNQQMPNFEQIDKTQVNTCCLLSHCPIGIENAAQLSQFTYDDAHIFYDDLPLLEKIKQAQDAIYRNEKIIKLNY